MSSTHGRFWDSQSESQESATLFQLSEWRTIKDQRRSRHLDYVVSHPNKEVSADAWSWTLKQFGSPSPGCYSSDMAEFLYECQKEKQPVQCLLCRAGRLGLLFSGFHTNHTSTLAEAVPRTPWPGYGIRQVSGPLTPCTEGKTPVDAPFRAVKPRIGNRCTARGDLCIRISGINRVLFSYCFRQFLRFRSDTHCFDCWRLDRDFTVTASLTVINGNFNAIRHEGSKVARNCMDASAIFIINTRNLNPNFSGCRNRIFDFDIPALDLTSFEWTYVLPYARINLPFLLPSICLKDMGKTKLIREATCEGHISRCLRRMTIRKRGMYSQYSRRNLGSIICLAFPHVRASVMDHGQEGRVCVITLWP